MKKIADFRRGCVRGFALAVAILALSAIGHQRAEALTLINPGAVPGAKYASDGLTTEVRGGHGRGGGHFHGGGRGGGFRGGFRGGGRAFHGGGFRATHVYRGGGLHRHHFHRHHIYRHHRRHFAYRPYYYAPAYYYPRRHCRIVMTYYGPRKICRYRPWHHHRHLRFRIY